MEMDQAMLKRRVGLFEIQLDGIESGQVHPTVIKEMDYQKINNIAHEILRLFGEEELRIYEVHEVLRLVESRLNYTRLPKLENEIDIDDLTMDFGKRIYKSIKSALKAQL